MFLYFEFIIRWFNNYSTVSLFHNRNTQTSLTKHTNRVQLPKIKTYLNFPFCKYSLHFTFAATSSETVFKKLLIDLIDAHSRDAAREPLNLNVSGVSVDFSGTISQGIEVSCRKILINDQSGVSTHAECWKWKIRLTGRIYARFNKLALKLSTRLVQITETNELALNLLSTSIDVGDIEYLKMEGFGFKGIGGTFITFLIPLIKGTPLIDTPAAILVNFIAKELIEGGETVEMLSQIVKVGGKYIDMSSFSKMTDEEREEELATTKSDIMPTFINLAAGTQTSSGTVTPLSTSLEIPPVISSTPKAFRLKSHLIGPSILTSCKIFIGFST